MKYTKLNISIMAPSIIMVYKVHASHSNICDMVTSFDKSIWDSVRNTFRSGKQVSLGALQLKSLTTISYFDGLILQN